MDIHHINTGRGNVSFIMLPDGTSLVIDCGDMSEMHPRIHSERQAPKVPNNSKTTVQWIADYIFQFHPKRENAIIDYALITHFHDDHFGEIDSLRRRGDLIKGVKTLEGGEVRILHLSEKDLNKYNLDITINDNIILATACHLKDKYKKQVTLVSKDINVRLKADILGLTAENYHTHNVNFTHVQKGYDTVLVDPELVNEIYSSKQSSELICVDDVEEITDYYENQYLLLQNNCNPQQQAIVRVNDGHLIPMETYKNVSGIKPRNIEQKIALDMLMNPDIKLVSLIGKAGSGKTLISIAAGLRQVMDDGIYDKLTVARPVFPMGNDIGFLPGTMEEKLLPWMSPIIDNLEYILLSRNIPGAKNVQDLFDSDLVHIEALTYIRGRSIPNQFIIIDEAQNTTPHEIKTIISRAGENTKIVLTGDPMQIDSPYLTKENNGLIYAMDRMKGNDICSHIFLEKCERSKLADLAADLL